jgi:hypothetical protein
VGDFNERGYLSKLVFDSQGTPYGTNLGNQVKKYEGGMWNFIGNIEQLGTGAAVAVDSHNTLYAASINIEDIAYYTVSLKRYNGTDWELVSTTPHEMVNGDYTSGLSITIDSNDIPYVSFSYSYNDGTLLVLKYEGGNWVRLGDGGNFYGSYNFPSTIQLDPNNIPYIFHEYVDSGTSSVHKRVSKFVNGAWEPVGDSALLDEALLFALDPTGVPYIVYPNGTKLGVAKYNGVSWETVGNADFELGFTSYGTVGAIDLAFDSSGTPYVAYADPTRGNSVSVVKYDGVWSYVGNAGFSVSAKESEMIQIAIDPYDNIYVTFSDQLTPEDVYVYGLVYVMRYEP